MLNELLTERADALARVSGFVRRRSKLGGAAFVQTLVFGWLGTPVAGIGALSRVAGALGVKITPQGLEQRFTPEAATYLQQVLAEGVKRLVESEPAAVPILRRFAGVYVQDSTTVPLPDEVARAWPACGNSKEAAPTTASLKLQVRLELTRGTVAGPEPHAGRASDRATVALGAALPSGALFIADLGYFSLPHVRTLGEDGVFWLSRLQVQTAVFATDGRRLDLLSWLREHATTPTVAVDQPVLLGVGRHLPARLLAVRVPPEVSATRRRKLHAEAQRRGKTVSDARLARADWTILVTNVPLELLTTEEALILARARWQIELLFKLWKSHGHLTDSCSQKPWRRVCELFAKLLALLIQHWLFLVTCWRCPNRSLVRAAHLVRQFALALALACDSPSHLTTTIRRLAAGLTVGATIDPRRHSPGTWQLLLAVDSLIDPSQSADWAA
ncbi:MAG TPA: IS4 family transposase [Nonomuraea sp.]|nr:IS4 family transposase [Nonomuraea sp.]